MKTVSSSPPSPTLYSIAYPLLHRLPSAPSQLLVISLSRNTPKRAIVSTSLSFVRFSNILIYTGC
ncbi:hypothetical protein Sjap_008464 [Stephania japonica]|uniref:Uncharacterized protein n=1 Tax=Stephania japonica TaxID=461633 RepID=A0AAP0JQD2_9MAGN